MRQFTKISLASAVAALAISPAQAVELPRAAAPVVQADYAVPTVLNDGADEAEHRRRYHRYRDNGVDAGDVIAGALIIGGIFAIASAASKPKRDSRYDRDYVSNDAFDRAVDACVNRVEREQRIGSVENVGRTRTGYSVSGTLYNGTGFACQVSGSGRVTSVDYGYGYGGASYQAGGDTYGDPQYSDDAYARARANTYSTYSGPDNSSPGYSAPASSAQPAYPGGPIPGEDPYGEDYYGADEYDGGEPY